MEDIRQDLESQINGYRQLLAQSDYKALKHADGALSDEEYAETRANRAMYRQKINECEAALAELEDAEDATGE